MPFFRHQQIEFYFEQSGDGPAVVLCHGLTGDSTQIRELVDGLAGHSLVLWDARAHGRTEPVGSENAFTFANFAADLHALLQHLKIQQAIVGGVSMGAGIATRFALEWPEMVSALIVIRPSWLDRPFPQSLNYSVQIGGLLKEYGVSAGRQRFETSQEYWQLVAADPVAARQFCEQFDKPQAVERCIRLQRMPASCPIQSWSELSRLTVPALVIGCDSDYVHPWPFAIEWSQRLPHAKLERVCSKSTNPQLHTQEVCESVARFLGSVTHPKED